MYINTIRFLFYILFFTFISNLNSVAFVEEDVYANLAEFSSIANPRKCRVGQFSSYDREGGFYDYNNYLYTQEDSGKVMAEMFGPGAITRIWMAAGSSGGGNYKGISDDAILRIYIDGAAIPVVDTLVIDLFGRFPPFIPPLAGVSSGGYYSYIPIPYKRHCKVVFYPGKTLLCFYHVTYQSFDSDISIRPFTIPLNAVDQGYLNKTITMWNRVGEDPKEVDSTSVSIGDTMILRAGEKLTFAQLNGKKEVSQIRIKISPAIPEVIQNTLLEIYWNNETNPSVKAPIGAFFGSGFREILYKSLPLGMTSEEYYCFFPMAFDSSAKFVISNNGVVDIDTFAFIIKYGSWQDNIRGKFNALWRKENPTKPDSDYVILNLSTTSPGHIVGSNLFISGDTKNLSYMEGDETFNALGKPEEWHGTGTEDYFNGGWYFSRGPFSLPLHGCQEVNWTTGKMSAYRFHISDYYPFSSQVKFSIEHGNQNTYTASYQSVIYWYSFPSKPEPITKNGSIQTERALIPTSPSIFFYPVSPNPSIDKTLLKFSIQGNGKWRVTLRLYDIKGSLCKTLLEEDKAQGIYYIPFSFKYSSGVYFIRLTVDSFSKTQKVVFIHQK